MAAIESSRETQIGVMIGDNMLTCNKPFSKCSTNSVTKHPLAQSIMSIICNGSNENLETTNLQLNSSKYIWNASEKN